MAKSKQTISTEEYTDRRKILIDKINKLYEKSNEQIYNYLYELYILEKQRNPNFTKLALARELNMCESTVYKYLNYIDAPEEIKLKVKNGEIPFVKALRVLNSISKTAPKEYKIKIFDYVIKNNMTEDEIDKYVRKDEILTYRMQQEREYKNAFNIYRDLFVGGLRITKILNSIDELPKDKIMHTLKILKDLKMCVDKSIIKLEKWEEIKNDKNKK